MISFRHGDYANGDVAKTGDIAVFSLKKEFVNQFCN